MASNKRSTISLIFSPITSIVKYFYIGITAPFSIFKKKNKEVIANEKIEKIDKKIDEMVDEKEKIRKDLISDKEREKEIER